VVSAWQVFCLGKNSHLVTCPPTVIVPSVRVLKLSVDPEPSDEPLALAAGLALLGYR
jgi:hypothetical protein